VRRARRFYFGFLAAAVSLFGVAAALTPWIEGAVGGLGLLRFVVLCLAIASGIATWYTAVMIASVHKVAWPLLTTLSLIVMAGLTFAVACYFAPPVHM
jgi:hypothetical protein